MSDRPLRASAAAGLCVFIALIGVRSARAQGGPDGGASPAAGQDAGPLVTPGETAPLNATTGSGPGLFEQSQAASAGPEPASRAAAVASTAPFTLNGYVRGDVFIGKVQDQNAAEMKA